LTGRGVSEDRNEEVEVDEGTESEEKKERRIEALRHK
jgi:hypothetical protein